MKAESLQLERKIAAARHIMNGERDHWSELTVAETLLGMFSDPVTLFKKSESTELQDKYLQFLFIYSAKLVQIQSMAIEINVTCLYDIFQVSSSFNVLIIY